MGCMTKLLKLLVVAVAVFFGVLLGPNILPENVKFTEFNVTPTKDLGKGATLNELLNNAERMFEGVIKGPEAFEVINGELYTSLHGGYVVKIFEDQVVPVVKFGQSCDGWWEESKCGRPLGLKAMGKDNLLVADAYYGLYQYNINNRKFNALVDKNTVIDGHKPQIFNGVEIARDGSIYWTHSSSDFSIENGIFTFLADGSGRLLKYDPATKKNTVLMKDLFFANGIVLSPEEDYILVAETGHSRILKFYLKGPKQFTSEIFIDGLPGMPDNLRRNGEGGYFVPLVMTRDEKSPAIHQVITPFPSLRKVVASLLSLLEKLFEKFHAVYPNYFAKRAIHFIGHMESVSPFLPSRGSVLEVDSNGNVIRSFHCLDGSTEMVSDVMVHNGYLYLGSPTNNYLGRVKLSNLGDSRTFVESTPTTPPAPSTTQRTTTTTTTPPKPSTPRTSTQPPTVRATTPPPPPSTRPPPPPSTRPPPPPSTRPPPPPSTRPPPPPPTRPRQPPSSTTPPRPSAPAPSQKVQDNRGEGKTQPRS